MLVKFCIIWKKLLDLMCDVVASAVLPCVPMSRIFNPLYLTHPSDDLYETLRVYPSYICPRPQKKPRSSEMF